MKKLTIDQARALHALSPVLWKAVECDGGWTVGTGEAKLVKANDREVRVFKTLGCVASQLRDRVGVFTFDVNFDTRCNVEGNGEGVHSEVAQNRESGAATKRAAFWTPACSPVGAS